MQGKLTHESGRVISVSADLIINLDEALHNNACDLTLGQGVLETVADQDDEGQALTELVGSGGGTRGKGAGQLVQHPRFGRRQTFKMLARSTSLNI